MNSSANLVPIHNTQAELEGFRKSQFSIPGQRFLFVVSAHHHHREVDQQFLAGCL